MEPNPDNLEAVPETKAAELITPEAAGACTEPPAVKRQKVDEEEEKEIPNYPVTLPAYLADVKVKYEQTKRFKKRKIGIIAGYNGSTYSGSQIQNKEDVFTVEHDVIKALYQLGMINKQNVCDIKKINFTRATRTDKRVHALQN